MERIVQWKTAKNIKKIRKALLEMTDGKNQFRKLYCFEVDQILKVVRDIDMMKSTLDDSYHRLIDDTTFKKLGHIYYGDDDAYIWKGPFKTRKT